MPPLPDVHFGRLQQKVPGAPNVADLDMDDDEDEPADKDLIAILGFDPDSDEAEDASFEESKHPRGNPKNAGQFARKGQGGGSKGGKESKRESTSGKSSRRKEAAGEVASPESQRESVDGLTGFLKLVAGAQERSRLPPNMTAPARLMLREGRQFEFDNLTYAGKRGKPQRCYENAGRLAINDPRYTYVEGYVVVHGVPIEHAWVVDADGKVKDPTIPGPKGIGGYVGIPITSDYLSETTLKTKTWGVFGWPKKDYMQDNPRKWVVSELGKPLPSVDAEEGAPPKSATHLLENYSTNTTVEAILAHQPKEVGVAIREAERKLAGAVPTNALESEGGFKKPDGTYTEERQQLHLSIVKRILAPEAVKAAKPPEGTDPTFTLIGGRAGSGKSYFTQSGVVGKDTLVLDNDSIKAMLPEYQGWNAALVHEEASDIFERVDLMARELGVNIAHDATMKTYVSAQRRMDAYKDKGYKTRCLYMFAPPQVAAQRAIDRFMSGSKRAAEGHTGRYVPPSYVLASTSNEASFDALRESSDTWELYKSVDTKNNERAELVSRKGKE